MSQLTIYKASAGSGKTFKLTEEYLMLLFKHSENYRRILAVTFTNKATAEMKSRILIELNKLAKGIKSDYVEILKNSFKLTESEIKIESNKILSSLLHDFSKFSVSTIDKFFQKIIRSFTREVGIQPGYSIELNQNEILSKVVDEMLFQLDENKELQEWLFGLATDKIEQGGKWDFKDDILKLGTEVFKEDFKALDLQLVNKMNDKEFLKKYIKVLEGIRLEFENGSISIAKEALDKIKESGLTIEDFKWGKSSVPNYFNKILNKDFEPNTRTLKGTESIDEWFTQKSPKKDIIESTLNKGLFDLLVKAVNYYQKSRNQYNSSIEILKFIHTLGILSDISKKLHEYCEDQNIFLISDASKLLQIIIDDNDAPFIYEKSGSIYKHFMIDEFQDTSKSQWSNFKPLIGNSLAHGSKNLVVGDIKQSIYRWRNGDWKILSNKIQNDFIQYEPKTQSLNTNWRSKKNIVDYNNAVFCYSSQMIQIKYNEDFIEIDENENPYLSIISDAYKDVFQEIPLNKNKEGGYVNHTFLLDKKPSSWKDEVKLRIPKIIENLQDNGNKLNEIAIIVRRKKEGQEIANMLIEYKKQAASKYKFDFISNDTLYLENSSVVRFILSVLEFSLNSEDIINLSFIAHEYHSYLKSEKISKKNLHEILRNHTREELKENLNEIFPSEFIESIDQIKQLPIYEFVDRIIRLFKLNELKSELPYLNAFLDMVLDFSKNSSSDIHTFINWWEESGNKKTLSVSENQDAIRIITIHSSKGLEFKNVIIPFCDWNIDHASNQNNILWCKTHEEPFNKLDLIPIKYSKNLINTVFKKNYQKEKLHAYVDNLNLLYVAFTRAEENLFCFSPIKENFKSIQNVGDLLFSTYKNHQNFSKEKALIDISESWNNENLSFKLGEIKQTESIDKELPDEFELNQFESFDIKNKLRLKLHDNSFFTGHESTPYKKVNHGKVMHEIFENIKTKKDISKAIDKLIFEGKISPKEINEIKVKIENTLKNEQVRSWFSDEWTVTNEAEIILTDGKTARPDRVISNNEKTIVIDYKFGEQEEDKHHKQVKSYIKILSEMENSKVEGYLWYVDLNFIRKVE